MIENYSNNKIVLLMNDQAYVGREYGENLIKMNIDFDLVIFGKSNSIINENEDKRCGNLWKVCSQDYIVSNCKSFFRFDKLDNSILDYFKKKSYSIGIQGGIGIIKEEFINLFSVGILNLHPGYLPNYGGCSAPEWQIYEKKPVYVTAHFIDKGIDTGEIIDRKQLNLNYKNYYTMRASIYPQIAIFLIEILNNYIKIKGINSFKQNKSFSNYNRYIGDDTIKELQINWIKYMKAINKV